MDTLWGPSVPRTQAGISNPNNLKYSTGQTEMSGDPTTRGRPSLEESTIRLSLTWENVSRRAYGIKLLLNKVSHHPDADAALRLRLHVTVPDMQVS